MGHVLRLGVQFYFFLLTDYPLNGDFSPFSSSNAKQPPQLLLPITQKGSNVSPARFNASAEQFYLAPLTAVPLSWIEHVSYAK